MTKQELQEFVGQEVFIQVYHGTPVHTTILAVEDETFDHFPVGAYEGRQWRLEAITGLVTA